MRYVEISFTPAEYEVIKEAIDRFEKTTAKGSTIQTKILNCICNDIKKSIAELEALAEATKE